MQADLILTADPQFFTLALAELQETAPFTRFENELADGVITAVTPNGFFAVAEAWRKQPPIFVRHICPVQLTLPLVDPDTDLTNLETLVREEMVYFFEPEMPFSVQTRCLGTSQLKPFAVNNALAPLIEQRSGAPLDVKAPVQVLSVVTDGKMAYLGISLAQQNLSDWAGGVRRFAKGKGQISRAEFKLLEAFEQFGLDLPANGRALDLGAAPGGWTRVLRQKEQMVTAVDPGQMDARFRADTAVRHLPITAEMYLTQYPDQYDLIVNDMRLDARDSARLMVAYAPYLYPHGDAIMTLKLPSTNTQATLDHACNILRDAYRIVQIRHLFHNRTEVTAHLQKNASA